MDSSNNKTSIKSTLEGVEIRGNSIRIIFYYKSVMCRETVATGNSKSDLNYASRRRAEILRKIADNEFDYRSEFPNSKNAQKFETKKPTCSELFYRLIERYNNSNKKPITKTTYNRIITNKLIPYFGDFLINEITPNVIKSFIEQQNHTAKYTNQLIMQIKAMLDYALNDGHIASHPFQQLALDKLISDVAIDSEYHVMPLTTEEQQKLFDCCDNTLIKWVIVLGINTGMRLGELIALRWDNVHSDHIEIKFNMVKGNLSSPKTKSGYRKILLLPNAKKALANLKLITGDYENVIVSIDAKVPWQNSGAFWKHWVALLAKSGIEYRNPYQMRHTYASRLLSNGENPLWVATQMGHTDTEMITRCYGKWIPQENNVLGYKLKGFY